MREGLVLKMDMKRAASVTRRLGRQLLRVAATFAVAGTLTLGFGFSVLPAAGAALAVNAGITGETTMLSALVTVIVPEFFLVALAVVATAAATRGMWRWLKPAESEVESHE